MAKKVSPSTSKPSANTSKSSSVVAFYDKAFATRPDRQRSGGKWSTDFPVDDETADFSLRTLAYQETTTPDNWIPRPALMIRILWVVLILTLGVLTVFAGLMAHLVSGITAKVYEEIQEPTVLIAEPLPEESVLRDQQQFEQILALRPERRLDLELARLAALTEHGDMVEARNLVRYLAQDHKLRHYDSNAYMDIAEHSAVLGFRDQAWAMLDGKDLSEWPPRDQKRAVALMGRLLPLR